MIETSRLEALDAAVVMALDGGSASDLDIVDYGEISTVLAATGVDGPVVCKRLPPMTAKQLTAYRTVLDDYLTVLAERGLIVAPSEVFAVGIDPASPYCVQPRYERLLTAELASADVAVAERWVRRLCDLVLAVARDGVGLDAQVSNWAIEADHLVYLDVTTPLLQDESGRQRADLGLFIASLPWALRWPVRRFLLGEILSHYHDPRPAFLDALGNLHKERLGAVIPMFLEVVNERIDPPITSEEARKYYRQDALMWEVLQRLRRADRWWQRRVRRRRYPFLLPGSIAR